MLGLKTKHMLGHILTFILKQINKSKRKVNEFLLSETYEIIKEPSKVFPVFYHIKDQTWENLYISEVFHVSKEYVLRCYHEEQNIIEIDNAIISSKSNIIISEKGVVWDKTSDTNFPKLVPLDSNVVSYSFPKVTVIRSRKQIEIDDNCISLGGVHSHVWTHFLVQYLPQLYYAGDSGLLNNSIKLLVPCYLDKHISKIVVDYISQYPNVSLVEFNDNMEYVCKKLYHIPISSQASDHVYYCLPFDFLLPQMVVKKLRDQLLCYLRSENEMSDKIYLARRETYRCMSNWQEAEDFFSQLGFRIIEPHKMTLEEKISVFNYAKVIVGPYSGAFTNLVFCNKAKVLIFSPLMRAYEAYYKTIGQNSNLVVLNVTGIDQTSDVHTPYMVPLDRIKMAYSQLINE